MKKFELSDLELKRASEFINNLPKAETGAIGGRISYIFTVTSIGVVIVVRDSVTNTEVNVTDFDSW